MFCFSLRKRPPGCSARSCGARSPSAQRSPWDSLGSFFIFCRCLDWGLLSLPAPERACFTVYFGRQNIALGACFTKKCLCSPWSRSCALFPSLIAHPEPEQRQGRDEGSGKTTCFSTVCKIEGRISPWVHLHRENAQPCLHRAIMTTAINALRHQRCAQGVGSLR